MLLMIDNYDSFTYNLVHYCAELGAQVVVRRNDAIDLDAVTALAPSSIIVSPGPCTPNEAGISMPLIEHFAGRIPILGVCLGHQSIGQVFGGRVVHARSIMHGKTSSVYHDGSTPFDDLSSPFTATRYHSLVIERDSLPECLTVTAWTGPDEDDEIMAVAHRDLPVWGVQFHPESILSEHGHALLQNFLNAAAAFNQEAAGH